MLAISKLIEFIYGSLNEKFSALCVFLDLRKAFDTVNHEVLLNKLYLHVVRGVPLALIADNLRDRTQCVRLGNVFSSFRTVNIGVPQSSILGPLLFLYYINDLPNVSKLLCSVLFADDTTLYAAGSDVSSLISMFNDELLCVSRWMRANVLSLNVSKTFAMMFSNGPNSDAAGIQLLLNGSEVQFECHGKFLGVIIDTKLNLKQHIHVRFVTRFLNQLEYFIS